jgi:hypothetical protein
VDLRSGKTETVLPGVSVSDYDLSRDEKEIVYTTKEGDKDSRISLTSLDRRTPPRQIATAGDQVSFGAEGDIFFRLFEQSTNTLARIKQDGSGWHKVGTVSIVNKYAVSPDGEWVIVHSANANEGAATLAVPVDGGPPRRICIQNCPAAWSSDGRFFYVARGASATAPARTLALPVPAGKTFPDLPAPGIDLAASHVSVPGAIVIDLESVSPGPDPATHVFTKSELVRNLFRIPLR